MDTIRTYKDIAFICRVVFRFCNHPTVGQFDIGNAFIQENLGLVLDVFVQDLQHHLTVQECNWISVPNTVSSIVEFLNEDASPFVHRFLHASKLTQDLSRLIAKMEGVQRWAKVQDVLEQSKLVQDPVAMRQDANAGTDLGSDVMICFEHNKVNVVQLQHICQREPANAAASNDDFEIVLCSHDCLNYSVS